jgi:hypothetical protein
MLWLLSGATSEPRPRATTRPGLFILAVSGRQGEPQAQGAFGPRLGPRVRALRITKDAQPRVRKHLQLGKSNKNNVTLDGLVPKHPTPDPGLVATGGSDAGL